MRLTLAFRLQKYSQNNFIFEGEIFIFEGEIFIFEEERDPLFFFSKSENVDPKLTKNTLKVYVKKLFIVFLLEIFTPRVVRYINKLIDP